MIRLSNVNKYFNKGRQNEIHVINNVSLELPQKGMVALFGKSGCGKTTLLNAIGGLDRIAGGAIEIDGKTIGKKTDDIRNQYIGYIFQNYNLNMLVDNYENVAEALRLCGMTDEKEIEHRVMVALKNVGLEKYIHRMPDTLSGGQKQRIAIARAIVKNPAIILADEPTGNLDEKNTIMIMDLLKSFSKDHLVLLVTHEANLVDYYCDQVIELSDGKIVSTRINEAANGYVGKEKNVVYLGDLEKTEMSRDDLSLEYYGWPSNEPIKIQLVNQNGVLMLKVNSSKVKLLDESSEVVFKEGTFADEQQKNAEEHQVDLSELPPVEGKKYGKLFHWNNTAKSSFKTMLAPQKKGNKALRRVMLFFVILLTIMTCFLSNKLRDWMKADEAYNHNTYYLSIQDAKLAQTIFEDYRNGNGGIDYLTFAAKKNYFKDIEININLDLFDSYHYDAGMFGYIQDVKPVKGHGVALSHALVKDQALVAGRKTELKEEDIVITKRLADIFLKETKLNFIKNYKDLLGLQLTGYTGSIVGIIESDEPAIYLNEITNIIANHHAKETPQAEKMDITYDEKNENALKHGETIWRGDETSEKTYKVGDQVNMYGETYVVTKVISNEQSIEQLLLEELGVQGTVVNIALPQLPEYDLDGIMDYYDDYYYDDYYYEDSNYYDEEVIIIIEEAETKNEIVRKITFRHYMELLNQGWSGFLVNDEDYRELYYKACLEDMAAFDFIIHSNDTEKTNEYLAPYFQKDRKGVTAVSPQDIRKDAMRDISESLEGLVPTMSIVIALLCLCMYMIMRSNLMGRVKEIGVYRCIGVTKKNICFKHAVEAFALTSVAILPGFLAVIGVIHYAVHGSPLGLSLYMPAWIVLLLLAFLYTICIFCGVLPALLLLRKTPSEIMAKYDV